MARRQHLLTTTLSVDSSAGATNTYNLVRIVRWIEAPLDRDISLDWEIGRVYQGNWDRVGNRHGGRKSYSGDDYDTLLSQSTPAAMEDKAYQDLVSDGVIGPGTQQDY